MYGSMEDTNESEQIHEFGPLSQAFYSYVIHENIQNYICMKGTADRSPCNFRLLCDWIRILSRILIWGYKKEVLELGM